MASLVLLVSSTHWDAWRGRRVLVTGHTGFKGAWLSLWLERLGAVTFGIALPPGDDGAFVALQPSLEAEEYCDILDRERVFALLAEWRPDVVFHLAAQALVPESYRDPIGTFDTNVSGTINVVAGSIAARAKSVVVVTSDKVYVNDEAGQAFTESDPLGGRDPYSASKACADIAGRSLGQLAEAAGTAVASARAGNVIGGGDAAADRLLPDIWRSLISGTPLQLRNPEAVRPWQFVLEPLAGYLVLAERLMAGPLGSPAAVNFGPPLSSCRPVHEVVDLAFKRFGRGTWHQPSQDLPVEAELLRLDSSRAHDLLGWSALLDLESAVNWTVDWWMADAVGKDRRAVALEQLAAFESLMG